ncbi:MAG: 2-oxoacid:ferredoxin oxidoreductase subunit beta [Planctomycetota bacterium]
MSTTAPEPQLKKKDFESDQDVRWCPGCGDYAILSAVQKTMPQLGVKKENIVFISGIGCSSRFPYYMDTYGFHTIHGRAPTFATGLKLANPELTVFVITGDGDGLSIGGNHLLHVLRRNVDVNILLFNNRIYGLTKGQYSPSSEYGKVTKSSPYGSVDRPLVPLKVALGASATFAARTVDRKLGHMEATIKRAVAHKGASFVEIYQNCNIFNDGAFSYLTDRKQKTENELLVEHGKPLVFGPVDNRRAIKIQNLKPTVVPYVEGEEGLWIYDETAPFHAALIPEIDYPRFPVPLGVFLDIEAPSYASALIAQEDEAITKKGVGDLQALVTGRDTWKVS